MFELRQPEIDNLTEMTNDLLAHCRRGRFVCIFPHVNADGDAIGAATALALALAKIGAETRIYLDEVMPRNLHILPPSAIDKLQVYAPETTVANWNLAHFAVGSKASDDLPADTVGIVVDCGGGKRLGRRRYFFASATYQYIIDHHIPDIVEVAGGEVGTIAPTATSRETLVMRDSKAAATCELIGVLLQKIGEVSGQDLFDRDIATCLMIGLLTDTGRFCYSNTRSLTLQLAAFLHQYQVPVNTLAQSLFETISPSRLQLMGIFANDTVFYFDKQLAICPFSLVRVKDIEVANDDFEGFSSQLRNITGVGIGIVLREDAFSKWRGSIRTSEQFDAQQIAAHFGGGGHKRAAGFSFNGSQSELVAVLLPLVEEQLLTKKADMVK